MIKYLLWCVSHDWHKWRFERAIKALVFHAAAHQSMHGSDATSRIDVHVEAS